jgi:hypothetical protein
MCGRLDLNGIVRSRPPTGWRRSTTRWPATIRRTRGPISVQGDDQKAQWHHEAEIGEYINAVCGQLKVEVAAVEQQASILHSTADSDSLDELQGLAGQCGTLSGQGYAAANQLVAAGVQDWVHSVKACNEVGFWANSAAGHAGSAAASEYPTEIHGYLGSAANDLGNAAASINGA